MSEKYHLNVQVKAVVEIPIVSDAASLKEVLDHKVTWDEVIVALKKGALDGSLKVVGASGEWDID